MLACFVEIHPLGDNKNMTSLFILEKYLTHDLIKFFISF